MTEEEKIEFIQTAIFEISKKEIKIEHDDLLLNLGLDSLNIVEMQMYYEDKTGNQLPDDAIIVTVSDLMKLMK